MKWWKSIIFFILFERIKIPTEKLRKYFPKNYTVEQIENEIIKLCEKNYRNKQRDAR